MPLINCGECGSIFSDIQSRPHCSKCGWDPAIAKKREEEAERIAYENSPEGRARKLEAEKCIDCDSKGDTEWLSVPKNTVTSRSGYANFMCISCYNKRVREHNGIANANRVRLEDEERQRRERERERDTEYWDMIRDTN